jgi:hypothetical protein
MVAGWTVTVRTGAKVKRERRDTLEAALARVAERGGQLQDEAETEPLTTRLGRFEPAQQIYARVELAGPGRLHAGVDVRGDGSAEAYTGRLRRTVIEQRSGELAYDALRRALTGKRTL